MALTENIYNLQPSNIKKLKILNWERLKQRTWKNNAMKNGTWYCHLEGVGKGLYGEPINEFWIGFNEDNDKIDFHYTVWEGMGNYKFKKFYDQKEIENKYDAEIQSRSLAWLNKMICEGILGMHND